MKSTRGMASSNKLTKNNSSDKDTPDFSDPSFFYSIASKIDEDLL